MNKNPKERKQWDISNLFYRIPTDWYSLAISSIDSTTIDDVDYLNDRISLLEKEIIELKEVLGLRISEGQNNMRDIMEGDRSNNKVEKIPLLRRNLSFYKPTRQKHLINIFKEEMRKLWSNFAPEINFDELNTLLEHILPNSCKSNPNDKLFAIIIANFQNSFDSRDNEGKIQFGSLLAAVYPSYEMLKDVTQRNFHRSLLTTLNYHNKNVGCYTRNFSILLAKKM